MNRRCKWTTPVPSRKLRRARLINASGGGSRISPRWGRQLPGGRQYTILPNFPKNCMKLKEFGPRGRPRAPLDPATGKRTLVSSYQSFHTALVQQSHVISSSILWRARSECSAMTQTCIQAFLKFIFWLCFGVNQKYPEQSDRNFKVCLPSLKEVAER